jgi:hypothetical protein
MRFILSSDNPAALGAAAGGYFGNDANVVSAASTFELLRWFFFVVMLRNLIKGGMLIVY